MKFRVALSVLALTVAVLSTSIKAEEKKNIVETAVAAGQFKTLAKALGVAGLVETLEGKGPFTVFAPTDEAFAKLPEETLKAVLADKAKLTKILLAHVVQGSVVKAADVKKLNGEKVNGFKIDTTKGVKIGDATVIKADIETSNGVIHVIDTVLIPQ
jgi:uncharacterized surface protein with fasciclin (FAS1) repeats